MCFKYTVLFIYFGPVFFYLKLLFKELKEHPAQVKRDEIRKKSRTH